MVAATQNIGQLAKEYAGNWQRFECFAWFARRPNPGNWTIVYTDNRDSGPLDRANAKAIEQALQPFIDSGDVVPETHNHWAVGHVNGYSIRVYRGKRVTKAFRTWLELQARMDDYPVLDDELHSRECLEEEESGWENWVCYDFTRQLEKLFGVELDFSPDPAGGRRRMGQATRGTLPNR